MTKGLEQLEVLIGEWTGGSMKFSEARAFLTVARTEDGKFFRLETREEHDWFPQSTQLVGSDESRDECTVLYHDVRGVHRVLQMSINDGVWRMWRDAPGFNQRFAGKIDDDGRTITGQWEKSSDGKKWEVDFDLSYTKTGD